MNSFSEEWLRLREPADAAARNPEIASGLAAHLADRTKVTFVDLGCGAGANLRHTALLLSRDMRQCWRLLDHDPRLLLSARGQLAAGPINFQTPPSGALQLEKGGREIEVSFCEADLNGNIERFLQPDEIVTASAFFDLVSRDWIVRFARPSRRWGPPFTLRSLTMAFKSGRRLIRPTGQCLWPSMFISAATRDSEQPPDLEPPPRFTKCCAKGDIPLLGATVPGDLGRKMRT